MTDPKTPKISNVLIPTAVILAVVLVVLSLIRKVDDHSRDSHGIIRVDTQKGAVLPDLLFRTLDQNEVKLSAIQSKVTLINFWASWCAPCLNEIPSINSLRKKFYDRGFEVIGVNVDDNPAQVLPEFQKKLSMEFKSYIDDKGTLSDQLDIHGIPFSIVLDDQRKILLVETGDRDWYSAQMQKQMSQWLGVKP